MSGAIVFIVVIVLIIFIFRTPYEFRDRGMPVPYCNKHHAFDKSALIFDTLLICATIQVPVDKLKHAANIAAEWLDNDMDGIVDDPNLLLKMKEESPPVVFMSSNGFPTFNGLLTTVKIFNAFDGYTIQDLYASETNPDEAGIRDASQEEIHHVIMNSGYQKLVPDIFSENRNSNSKLYNIWKYCNDNGYYSYNDPTCNDSCKVTEFVYLATAAYFNTGSSDDITALDLASNELTLKTKQELNNTIPDIITIFEQGGGGSGSIRDGDQETTMSSSSSSYVYPTNHWPTGNYANGVYDGINIEYYGI